MCIAKLYHFVVMLKHDYNNIVRQCAILTTIQIADHSFMATIFVTCQNGKFSPFVSN